MTPGGERGSIHTTVYSELAMGPISVSDLPPEVLEDILLSLASGKIVKMREVISSTTDLNPHLPIDPPQPPIGQPPLPRHYLRFPAPPAPHRPL